MKPIRIFSLAVAVAVVTGGLMSAQPPVSDKSGKSDASFGALRAPDAAAARKLAEAWLKSTGADAATLTRFNALWQEKKTVLEMVAETLALGDPAAAKLLASARDDRAPAPTELPALLRDARKPAFYRANLGLAYARALTLRKVYEEALEALLAVRAEDVIDPSAYYFHRAVCEHALMLKDKADGSIDRLLVDISDSPQRYREVASLMHFDMLTWREKDLGWIARKMDSIQRRLDLQRGGKLTQRMQKEVLLRLDEMIKEIENQQKGGGSGDGNDGNCPPGGQPDGGGPNNNVNPSRPQDETQGGDARGTGEAERKKIKEIAEVWGKLPEKDRERVMQELRRKLPARDRAIMDAYIREMQKRSAKP